MEKSILWRKKKSACGIRPSLKKRSFNVKNTFYIKKRVLWTKKKVPAALGPAQQNAVLQFKNTFYTEQKFYEEKKAPAALGPAQKNALAQKSGLAKYGGGDPHPGLNVHPLFWMGQTGG